MFQERRAIFIYCVSPVHMGAGTALGIIDNPIQRERHTEYPILAGSGIKGAIRHDLSSQDGSGNRTNAKELIQGIFGPDPETRGSEHAGAISFSDSHLVLFPVRSIKEAFAYASSPTALGWTFRTLRLAGANVDNWAIPTVSEGSCLTANDNLCGRNGRLPLEAFDFAVQEDNKNTAKEIAKWLSANALPAEDEFSYFRNKMGRDLVILSDQDFGYFVRNATIVEPHVRIDDVSGTAGKNGLFYTENLPPESLLLCISMASQERKQSGMAAKGVLDTVIDGKNGFPGLDGRMIQIGGDATTGRGQVVFKAVKGGNHAK